jgi:hypothetical protein
MLGSQSEFTAGELLGMTSPSAARIENGKIEPARQAVEHGLHVGQGEMNLVHVAPDHDVRQSARATQRLDVLLRRMRVALVTERQRAVEKLLARFGANLDELRDREFFEGRLRFARAREILAHNPGVDLADGGFDFARAKIFHLDRVEAFVGLAAPERGDVRNGVHFLHE